MRAQRGTEKQTERIVASAGAAAAHPLLHLAIMRAVMAGVRAAGCAMHYSGGAKPSVKTSDRKSLGCNAVCSIRNGSSALNGMMASVWGAYFKSSCRENKYVV